MELDGTNAALGAPIVAGAADVLAAIATMFSGATRLQVRAEPAADAAPRRLTQEAVRDERLGKLRRRDPALDAAVEMLDLELLD
jgi:hypothetical protein